MTYVSNLALPGHGLTRTRVHGVAILGTSVMRMTAATMGWGAGLYTISDRITSAVGVPVSNLAHDGSPVNSNSDECLHAQVTEALALRTSGHAYRCAILDGDNPAASYLFGGRTAAQAAAEFGAELDRLTAAGWLSICLYRGVGVASGPTSFGPELRPYMWSVLQARRGSVHMVNVWKLFGETDTLTDTVPNTAHALSEMFSDTSPVCDHYSSLGASYIAPEIMSHYSRFAAESA